MKYLLKNSFVCIFLLISVSLIFGQAVIKNAPLFPVISDSLKYIEIAESIQLGKYATIESIIYPPGYPAFLATIFSLFNTNPTTIYLVQFILLGGIAGTIYLIGKRHLSLSPLFATLAGVLLIVWPYMVLYSILIMSEILYIFFLVVSILILLEALRSDKKLLYGLAGVLFGITILIRPVALLLPLWLLILILFILFINKLKFPKLANIGILFLLLLITLTPWSIYLYTQTGSLIPVSSHLPNVIAKSNAIGYDESYVAKLGTNPSLKDKLQSKAKNFFVFWNPGAGGYQAEHVTERMPLVSLLIVIYKIGFFFILILAFLSLFVVPSTPLVIIWCSILYVWMLHTVLYPYPRYMLPVIPLVVLLSLITIQNRKIVYGRINSLWKNHFKKISST